MGYGIRNPFKTLNELPDKPRLGANLLVIGLAILGLRFAWPKWAEASFHSASQIFYDHFDFFRMNHRYPHSPQEFGELLATTAVFCVVAGAFIFLRRCFWWVAERQPEKEITQLKLK